MSDDGDGDGDGDSDIVVPGTVVNDPVHNHFIYKQRVTFLIARGSLFDKRSFP